MLAERLAVVADHADDRVLRQRERVERGERAGEDAVGVREAAAVGGARGPKDRSSSGVPAPRRRSSPTPGPRGGARLVADRGLQGPAAVHAEEELLEQPRGGALGQLPSAASVARAIVRAPSATRARSRARPAGPSGRRGRGPRRCGGRGRTARPSGAGAPTPRSPLRPGGVEAVENVSKPCPSPRAGATHPPPVIAAVDHPEARKDSRASSRSAGARPRRARRGRRCAPARARSGAS